MNEDVTGLTFCYLLKAFDGYDGCRMLIIPIGHSIIPLIKTYINYLVVLLGKRGISCVHLQKNQQNENLCSRFAL